MWRILLATVFLMLYTLIHWHRKRFYKIHQQLGSKYTTVPIVGHAYHLFGNDEAQMTTYKKFGREAMACPNGMSSYWLGHRFFIMCADAVNIDFILKTCMEKSKIMRFARNVIGNGSLFAPVSIWRPRRKILAPTFTPRSLASFVQIFADQSAIMCKKLQNVAHGKPVSLWSYITTFTMDSVCESTLGVQVKAQDSPNQPFLIAFDEGSNMVASRTANPLLHSDAVYRLLPQHKRVVEIKKCLEDFVQGIIKSKREEMKTRAEKGTVPDPNAIKSFLEMLVESSGGYSDEELLEETLVLVLAGTDTSAVGTAFTALALAVHQDVQEKVFQELMDIYGTSDRQVVAEDLPRMKYTEAVIKETLRVYPPVPLIVRETDKKVTLPSGLELPHDCLLLVNIWAMHRNPKYWGEDAEEYKPERFMNGALKHPAQFIPFSHGPRNCLGYQYAMQSMKTSLATMLRQFRLLAPPSMPPEPRCKYGIMMKDVNNFTVILQPRS